MYQYPVRPNRGGRKFFAQSYPSSSRSQCRVVPTFPLQSSLFESKVFRAFALALGTICVITSLSACGGVSYRSQSTTGGSGSNTTTSALSSILCATPSLTGAASSSCTATLSGAASSATSVTLASSNSALQVPSTVTIAAGATAGSFNAVASAVSKTTSVTITGSADGVTKTDVLTLNPQSTATVISLSSISCASLSLTGAASSSCTATLSGAASSATNVTLASSNSALQVPSTVTIAAGATAGSFKAVSTAVSKTTSVTISGSADGVTRTDVITVYPQATTQASLSKLSCASLTLTGATTTACLVSLSSAPTSPVQVTLASNNKALEVPGSVTVPTGLTTAAFVATSLAVTTTQSATLTATANGVSQSSVLQLNATQATPVTQYQVQLSWNAATSSSVTITGYNVYRSLSGSSYQLLNNSPNATTNYTDATVQTGQTYDYVVTTVDSAGAESSPSNQTTVTIP